MAHRKITFNPGELYHIYNRTPGQELLFRSADNYLFLLRRITEALTTFQFTLIAYCLMPNHYHFLLRQDGVQSPSTLIQQIFNSYTKAYNKMYARTGTLFESRFKAIHIDDESYLLQLCRYIHRNPLDARLVSDLSHWPYSNYLEWIEQRNGKLVDREFIRIYFPTAQDYAKFVLEYDPPAKIKNTLQRYMLE